MANCDDPLKPLIEVLADRVSDHHLLRYTAGIWQTDRIGTHGAFMRTQEYARGQMLAAGADEAEIVEIPADGRTRCENWIMPMAFDCAGARVEVVAPAYELLADWTRVPQCVVQWSGPTPPDGITADVVLASSLDPNAAGAAEGKIVLTDGNPTSLRVALQTWRAAAVVSYWLREHITDRTATCWANSFSIHPGGWGVLADEPLIPAFVLSPVIGEKLAERVAGGQCVVLRVWADTKVHAGVLPVSTGVIRGRESGEEVLVLGHAAEVGADDNASGCAVMLEAIRVLAGLIDEGRLPRPRRSMRVLLSAEIYGMLGYACLRDSLGRTLAGLHLDLIGDAIGPDRPVTLFAQSPTNASYVNDLVELIRDRMPAAVGGPGVAFVRKAYTGVADDMIGDPAFGVPCPWIGRPIKNNPYYHSSGDDLRTIDPQAMLWHATLATAYLYFLASAGDAEGNWLADATISRARAAWHAKPADDAAWLANYAAKAAARRCAELCESQKSADALRARVDEALPGFDEPLPDLASTPADGDDALVVHRVTRGVLKFDGRGPELEAKFGGVNWSSGLASALYWADGHRNIAQLRRLTAAEWGKAPGNLVEVFKAAAGCGMIRLTPAGG
ncbi:MAG: hypothetical protein BIFFINMI_04131 [Phycisphaerae bacterium]|nr:hypothetical protein [Phycisphaerae bacterium]